MHATVIMAFNHGVFPLEGFIRILIISLVSVTNSNKCQGTWIKSETFRH